MLGEAQKELTTPEFKQKLASLFAYLAKHLGIRSTPLVKIVNSKQNSENPFGLTGHYEHQKRLITLYITDRHDTDILRSFAHEVIHHWQNERGTLHPEGQAGESNPANGHYAQENPWLRKREMEAYLFGNILFRDWQDENRHGTPAVQPVLPQPLDENLQLADGHALKHEVERFVRELIAKRVLGSYHRERTSGDMDANDFSEDLTHKILSSISDWVQTVNNRGNWENQPDMIK